MLIAVTGGTGTLGRPVVDELVRRGHGVRVLTRRPPPRLQPGDLTTGVGLDAALAGVDAVVDASNRAGSGRVAAAVIVDGTRRLQRAAARARVAHHLAVSIVGSTPSRCPTTARSSSRSAWSSTVRCREASCRRRSFISCSTPASR